MTSYNLVFYCRIKKEESVFCNRVCVHHMCHGYQLSMCCTVPNERIRLECVSAAVTGGAGGRAVSGSVRAGGD